MGCGAVGAEQTDSAENCSLRAKRSLPAVYGQPTRTEEAAPVSPARIRR
jgi:hypothetical protein